MTTITILPLQGIDIAEVGSINLGESKPAVERMLGRPGDHSDSKRSFYPAYECRIDFDESEKIEFIEFIYGPFPEGVQLTLYGIDRFSFGAENLVALLAEKNAGPVDDREAEHCYTFENISVGIWRQTTEKDLEEWIAEKRQDGEYEIDRTWIEEEVAKAKNFWTIGIGTAGYYTVATSQET